MSQAATSIPTNIAAPVTGATLVPPALLENLAARFRPSGLCLMLLGPDGTVAFHDAHAAGAFFQRFVLPVIQHPELSARNLCEELAALGAASPVSVWNALP